MEAVIGRLSAGNMALIVSDVPDAMSFEHDLKEKSRGRHHDEGPITSM